MNSPSDNDESRRYSRQTILPEIGEEGQRLLKNAKVAVVGSGGLGSPVLLYLAAAGVGTLGIIDMDRVDESNLQRQVLFRTNDRQKLKVEVASERLQELNPHIDVRVYPVRLEQANALAILRNYDVVVDATDNFEATTIINDTAMTLDIPMVYGSIFQYEGQVSVFWKSRGPCYRCIYPQPPKYLAFSGADAGVLGSVPGIVGTIQSFEVIKVLLERGGMHRLQPLLGRLLIVDAATMNFREFQVEKRSDCSTCATFYRDDKA